LVLVVRFGHWSTAGTLPLVGRNAARQKHVGRGHSKRFWRRQASVRRFGRGSGRFERLRLHPSVQRPVRGVAGNSLLL
jgi:hypothetical protein